MFIVVNVDMRDFYSMFWFVWSQSWAHRSFKLRDRSRVISDPWFSERKEKSEERLANCQMKEFANRSKRSLNSKERWARSHFEGFALERCKENLAHGFWQSDFQPTKGAFLVKKHHNKKSLDVAKRGMSCIRIREHSNASTAITYISEISPSPERAVEKVGKATYID